MVDEITIKRIEKNLPILNEAQKRMYLAPEAEALGHGGITQISKATGVVKCKADTSEYPKEIKVTDEELAAVNLYGDEFHPNWNYTICANKCTN